MMRWHCRSAAQKLLILLCVAYCGLFLSQPVFAHAFAPSLLEVRETGPGHVLVRWKQPAIKVFGSSLFPLLPESCHERGERLTSTEGTGVVETWGVDCPDGIIGKTIRMEGIAASQTNVLLRLVLADGRTVRHILNGEQPGFVVPAQEGKLDVMASYGRIGIEHILTGFDHLLFVLGLVLLVQGGQRLLWTVTAFTVGHSITLALAVLGFVHVPQQPIEAGIALSIYVLAVELAPHNTRKPTLMERAPWFIAGLFGLLHGLGFAGALSQIGLPENDIPLTLFAFNLGIEAGQLLFVAVVLLFLLALRRLPLRWPRPAAYVPAYTMGTFAAFWFFQRVAASLTGIG